MPRGIWCIGCALYIKKVYFLLALCEKRHIALSGAVVRLTAKRVKNYYGRGKLAMFKMTRKRDAVSTNWFLRGFNIFGLPSSPFFKASVKAIGLLKTLLKQELSSALTRIAMVTTDHYR